MSALSPLLLRLIDGLRCLPGVGPKTAQRMALHLLERDRDGARRLADDIVQAMERIGRCRLCRNLSETELCSLCESPTRDRATLCVLETPADVLAVEQAASYRGLYFVLMGHLSPLDGVGPEQLGLDVLERRLQNGASDRPGDDEVSEVILATNPTVEGEATAHYVADLAQSYGVRVTRIAHGVPLGGELEYIDGGTLSHAFSGRRDMEL